MKPEVRIPLARPWITDLERNAALRVLDSDALSIGEEQFEFEREFSAMHGGVEAVAVSSGSAALYLTLRAMGITSGEVITPSYGFVATSHAIRLAGCTPRYCEVDPKTLCVDASTVDAAWSPDVSAIIPVDVFGYPAPMREIMALAEQRGVPVIEDSCEALGSLDRGDTVGTVNDAASFAFYPNKQMTTGEGGIVLTRHEQVATKIRSLRNQGRGEGEFEFAEFGFNFRLTELQAAIGRAQLSRLQTLIDARQEVAETYFEHLEGTPGLEGLCPVVSPSKRSWFVFVVQVEHPEWRTPVRDALAQSGIQTSPYFRPVHTMPPYADPTLRGVDLTATESIGQRSFALPFHPRLERAEVAEVCSRLREALEPLARGATMRFGQTPQPQPQ